MNVLTSFKIFLNLNYNYFTQYNSLKLFSSISNMPKLEQIVFGGNEIGDEGASNLIESLPSLFKDFYLNSFYFYRVAILHFFLFCAFVSVS